MHKKIIPTEVLYDVRTSVSEILNRPFTEHVDHQIFKSDQRILSLWAAYCADHVLPYFESKYHDDGRPRKAIEVLRKWVSTGELSMAVIRVASLSAHEAAKGKKDANAIFAAHAAGQAVATANVFSRPL